MTRITKDRGSLAHEDSLDALAMGVEYWVEQMAADVDMEMQQRKDELLRAEIDRFLTLDNVNSPKRANTWI